MIDRFLHRLTITDLSKDKGVIIHDYDTYFDKPLHKDRTIKTMLKNAYK